MTEDDLDSLFAAARAAPPQPSVGLAARVLAEADAHLAEQSLAPHRPIAPPQKPRVWTRIAAIFGGGGVLAGLATATVAGFWIGFAQPLQLDAMSAVLTGTSAEIDMMPGLDALLEEAP